MKVLVTGALGELGSDLCPQLARGLQVRRTDLRAARLVGADDYVRADLTRPDQLPALVEGMDAVVHFAALLPHDYTTEEFMDSNAKATTLLAEAAADAGVKRFVYASTIWATGHGQQEGRQPIDEDSPWRPIEMYGHTKLLGEVSCEYFARNRGLSVVVLRLGGYHRQPAARPEGGIDWERVHWPLIAQDSVLPGQRLFDPADLGRAVAAALSAEDVSFRRYLIGQPLPFAPGDAEALRTDTLAVLDRYWPGAAEMAAEIGWQPRTLERWYDTGRAERELGFRAATDLGEVIRHYQARG
ncbi:MAG TPA: NAD(P)-dependent oxidoreductase [Armatimonadota bacterium]|nr:NAD(P)-dependent oxidoreductase [Armatimonadota bacterium]